MHRRYVQFLRGPFSSRGAAVTASLLFWALAFSFPASGQAQSLDSPVSSSVAVENATNIKTHPLSILAKFPKAGPAMAHYVAQALIRQPSLFDAIISIIPDTSPQQASAIGAGLVRAVRAMGGKYDGISRAITFKVNNSDNPWLKTTFMALGSSYRTNVSLGLAAEDRSRAAVFANIPLGDGMSEYEGRVGPEKITNLFDASRTFYDRNCTLRLELYKWRTCRGMIVAMVASDAPSKGVVSISPTN